MKKIICSALLLLAFVPSVFAAGHMDAAHTERHEIRSVTDGHGESSMLPSILVNEVDVASVGKMIEQVMAQQEKESGITYKKLIEPNALTFTREDTIQKDGKTGKADIAMRFLLEQRGKDVLVRLQPEVNVKLSDGTVMGPYTTFTVTENSYHSLDGIKAYFNGEYIMGYSLGKKTADGFVIDAVPEGFPFAASGIKAGDIMVSVNGKKAVDYEEEFNRTGLRDIFSSEAVEYEIMRDGKIAKYSVVPAFISPEEFQKQYASKN